MSKAHKFVYVVLHEHYHFPSEPGLSDGDIVGCRPIGVYAATDTGRIGAKKVARDLAEKHKARFTGEVKEHGSGLKGDEFRIWVDSENPHAYKFVWIVRATEYFSG